jgi:hypothetical protein
MKTADPMPELRKIFMESRPSSSVSVLKTRGRPRVEITQKLNTRVIIFHLRKTIKGQTFLGIYPLRSNLPDADGLIVGDYALLQSGEVIQIL